MSANSFEELRNIAALARRPATEPAARESLVRYLAEQPSGIEDDNQPVVNALLSQLGLFPYIVGRPSSTSEQLALEYHVPQKHPNHDFVFHAEQKRVFDRLLDGHNVILSAPTSFGKSAILEAIVASGRWPRIAVIVPTNALIDETRRRINQLGTSYAVITHPSQQGSERCVFVLTQERFLELSTRPVVDLFVLDEFYKLQPSYADDGRAALLNMAWMQLRASGAQYYLIGPNIQSLSPALDEEIRDELLVSEFRTVVVDLEDRSAARNRKKDLLELASNLVGSALVFTSGPAKARTVGGWLASTRTFEHSERAIAAADWLRSNYDFAWDVPDLLRQGVGLHYGPLPRGIQRIMVRLFNENDIQMLVCTSTLIEGVNTAAESVIIYDKAIDNQTLDFFTFSNIRGRAGRMFRHFVGRVYTYLSPPDPEDVEVDIPIDTQSRLASLAALVQLDPANLTDEARARLRPIYAQDQLSIETIRANKGVDPLLQIDLASSLRSMSDSALQSFAWSGVPAAGQLRSVLEFAFDQLVSDRTRQYTSFDSVWAKLQANRSDPEDMTSVVDSQEPYSKDRSKAVDDVFDFKRKWMTYQFPSILRTTQEIASEVLADRGLSSADYSVVVAQIESHYLPNFFVDLEDYGLPLPLALKLQKFGLGGESIDELLASLRFVSTSSQTRDLLSEFEFWVLDDVLLGL